eukprot:m.128739 g.128739  ORF g.128739 m.128739 type:complete len:1232 (+) comp16744_c0_seq2:307-4002(+)
MPTRRRAWFLCLILACVSVTTTTTNQVDPEDGSCQWVLERSVCSQTCGGGVLISTPVCLCAPDNPAKTLELGSDQGDGPQLVRRCNDEKPATIREPCNTFPCPMCGVISFETSLVPSVSGHYRRRSRVVNERPVYRLHDSENAGDGSRRFLFFHKVASSWVVSQSVDSPRFEAYAVSTAHDAHLVSNGWRFNLGSRWVDSADAPRCLQCEWQHQGKETSDRLFFEATTGQCLPVQKTCPAGQFEITDPSQFADRACARCSGQCASGRYAEPESCSRKNGQPKCRRCHPSCQTCSGPSWRSCDSCSAPSWLWQSRCVPECPPGSTLAPALRRCSYCPKGSFLAGLLHNTTAIGSNPDHNIGAGTHIDSGMASQFTTNTDGDDAPSTTTIAPNPDQFLSALEDCQPCHETCATCFGPEATSCITCGTDLVMNSGVCRPTKARAIKAFVSVDAFSVDAFRAQLGKLVNLDIFVFDGPQAVNFGFAVQFRVQACSRKIQQCMEPSALATVLMSTETRRRFEEQLGYGYSLSVDPTGNSTMALMPSGKEQSPAVVTLLVLLSMGVLVIATAGAMLYRHSRSGDEGDEDCDAALGIQVPSKPGGLVLASPMEIIHWWRDHVYDHADVLRSSGSPCPWFVGQMDRNHSEAVLKGFEHGTYLVRVSNQLFCQFLSVVLTPSRVAHFMIEDVDEGFRLRGSNHIHASLRALVRAHRATPLPIINTGVPSSVTQILQQGVRLGLPCTAAGKHRLQFFRMMQSLSVVSVASHDTWSSDQKKKLIAVDYRNQLDDFGLDDEDHPYASVGDVETQRQECLPPPPPQRRLQRPQRQPQRPEQTLLKPPKQRSALLRMPSVNRQNPLFGTASDSDSCSQSNQSSRHDSELMLDLPGSQKGSFVRELPQEQQHGAEEPQSQSPLGPKAVRFAQSPDVGKNTTANSCSNSSATPPSPGKSVRFGSTPRATEPQTNKAAEEPRPRFFKTLRRSDPSSLFESHVYSSITDNDDADSAARTMTLRRQDNTESCTEPLYYSIDSDDDDDGDCVTTKPSDVPWEQAKKTLRRPPAALPTQRAASPPASATSSTGTQSALLSSTGGPFNHRLALPRSSAYSNSHISLDGVSGPSESGSISPSSLSQAPMFCFGIRRNSQDHGILCLPNVKRKSSVDSDAGVEQPLGTEDAAVSMGNIFEHDSDTSDSSGVTVPRCTSHQRSNDSDGSDVSGSTVPRRDSYDLWRHNNALEDHEV